MVISSDILNAGILIVDDQQANVALLNQMLGGAGYVSVSSTTDPSKVCELHRKNRYDLILLDLQMPRMDGFEVMEGLKQIEASRQLPVLVITAQPAHKLRALKAGARDFIGKPFDLAEVLLRVHNMIEVSLLHRDETLQSLKRLENSQRIALIGDWEHDLASGRTVWSEEIYRILGISRLEFPPSAEKFDSMTHPEDLGALRREREAITESERRLNCEHRIVRPGGEIRFVHQIAETAFDASGRPVRESGTIQDVTERKQSEEALRMQGYVLESMAEGVNVVNEEGTILFSNEACDAMFGYPHGSLVGRRASVLNERPAQGSGESEAQMRERLELTGRWSGEMENKRKDGTVFTTRARVCFMEISGRRCTVAVREDITRAKQFELQLLRVQRVESISRMASGIAHDMNNVLAPIVIAVHLLRKGRADEEKAEKLFAMIEASANRGSLLIKQLLYFGRGIEGRRTALRISDSVREIHEMIDATFPRNITIKAEPSKDPLLVLADSTQVHQVLLNLCVNARDAMPEGGSLSIKVTNLSVDESFVGRSPEAKPGRYVLVAVSDSGTGIPAELRERIFEPFFTTKKAGEGTGIGLSTVIAIVKGHGGFVTLESEVGAGTTFRVYLPEMVGAPALLIDDPGSVPPIGRNETVLIVDDEEPIREVAGAMLREFGYRVLTASNGAEGTVIFAQRENGIKLVIADYDMPVMDGLSMIRVIKHIDPAAKVIMTTGQSGGLRVAKEKAELESLGIGTVLEKPFTASSILSAIHALVGSAAACPAPEAMAEGELATATPGNGFLPAD